MAPQHLILCVKNNLAFITDNNFYWPDGQVINSKLLKVVKLIGCNQLLDQLRWDQCTT